jgi:hypothetical protein
MATIATPDTNLILILLIAGVNLYTAIVTSRTRSDVKALEKNTNSKMDALLVVTAKSSKQEGHEEGIVQGRKEAGDERSHKDPL